MWSARLGPVTSEDACRPCTNGDRPPRHRRVGLVHRHWPWGPTPLSLPPLARPPPSCCPENIASHKHHYETHLSVLTKTDADLLLGASDPLMHANWAERLTHDIGPRPLAVDPQWLYLSMRPSPTGVSPRETPPCGELRNTRPRRGRANRAIVEAIAEAMGLPRAWIRILRPERAPTKSVSHA